MSLLALRALPMGCSKYYYYFCVSCLILMSCLVTLHHIVSFCYISLSSKFVILDDIFYIY